MSNYIFDKRKTKKYVKKYGIIFGAMFLVVLALNFAMVQTDVGEDARRVFLVVFGLFFVGAVEWVLYMRRIKEKEQQKDSNSKTKKTIVQTKKTESKTVNKKSSDDENIKTKQKLDINNKNKN